MLEEVRERGPIPASALTDPQRRDGEWWDRRSVGRQALEALAADGLIVGWRSPNFERVYDIPERVVPESIRAQPTPTMDEAHDALLLRAAQYLGVATPGDLAYYYMINPRAAKARIAALAASGRLTEVRVEGWRDRAYMLPGTRASRSRRDHATLLSPFDSLIWERARTSRLFGFDYTIEVYVPEPKRTYGYYVLPMLYGDDLVAALRPQVRPQDLDPAGTGLVPRAGCERGSRRARREHRTAHVRAWLGLDDLVVAKRGNLASALRRMR